VIGRKQSLILWGESRLGKTLWARSLGSHIYWGSQFSLDEFTETAAYAVFDDMQGGLTFFPSYKSWLGHQADFICTDKYRGKRRIFWGKPAIYLSNSDPRLDKGADVEWLEANCQIVHLRFPIFRANTE